MTGLANATTAERLAAYGRKEWLRAVLLLVIGVVVRAPALPGQFIWDDQFLARDSPFIKSPLLILETFRHYLFPDSYSAHYRPVQNLSFIFDYCFWNGNTFGFHLTNVLLHASTGVLLYFLLKHLYASFRGPASERSTSLTSIAAFFTAALWSVHPVHSAAIDYISGRADSLAAFFACGAWLLFIVGRGSDGKKRRGIFFAVAAVSALLALCSRETAGLWMVVFLVHQLFFGQANTRRANARLLLAILCIFAGYLALRQLPGARLQAGPSTGWPNSVRAIFMLRALGDYGRLMIFPANLHMERTLVDPRNYDGVSWRGSVATEYLSIVGLLVLSTVAAACSRRTPAQRMRIFGAIWFFLTYLPTSNLIELNATVAEHWLYLPSIGFLIFLAGCALDLPKRARTALGAFATIATVALGLRSAIRSSDWVTPATFFERTVAAGGESARLGVNLALIYSDRGEDEKAEVLLRKLLKSAPDFPVARNNLASLLQRRGKFAEAEALFAASKAAAVETRKDYPHTWIASVNLARVEKAKGDLSASLAILEHARAEYPHIWEIVGLEAEFVRGTEGPERARKLIDQFLAKNWWHHGARIARGRLLAQEGDAEGALASFRFASWLDVNDAESLFAMASLEFRQNHLQEACALQRRAVARQPDQPRQYLFLSDILEKLGRHEEALANVAQVERLRALAPAGAIN